jgi:hypothetical protein
MGKTFNTGYLQNIIQYDGSNNIILPSLIGTGTRIVVAAANGTLSSQTASTTNIAEGTNLYYTDTRVGTYLSANTYATQSYVTTAIANLVDASPATLDTLNELAAALGDDPNFATTVATSIGTKQTQLNGTGFVKVSGTTVSYDNSTYLTTSSASSTYVPYTGASADLVLGANNFSSKRVSVLKSSDGYGGFTSNYLFLQTGSSTTNVGVDGISLLSKPNTRALVINYDIGGTNYGATLDASLLTGGRTFEFPNASGILALTSNIPTNNNQLTNGAGYITSSALSPYLPLAGGTLTGSLGGTNASFSSYVTMGSLVVNDPGAAYYSYTNRIGGSTAINVNSLNVTTELGKFLSSGLSINSGGGATNNMYQISFGYKDATGVFASSAIAGIAESSSGYNTGALVFATRSATTDTAPVERFRIASTGLATFTSTLRVGGATGNFLIDSYTTSKIGVRSWTDTSGTTNNFFIQNSASYNYGIIGVVSASGTSTGDVYGLGYSPSAGTSMTPVLNWTSAGYVGIQNSDPQARLHIGAALVNSADVTNGLILKQTSTNETTGIYLERSGERKGYAIYVGGSFDSLNFQRNNAGTKSDTLTLTRDGHVGINQQNPTGLGGPTFVVAGSGYPEVIVEKTGSNARKWGFTVGSDGSYLLRDYTSGANVFTVNTSGTANFSNNPTVGGNNVWTSANDGSGSGLDADLLDGRDSGGYMTQVQGGIEFAQGSYTGWYKLARSSQATNGAGGRGAFKIIVAQTGNYLVPSQDEIKGFKDWGTTLSITSIESTKESIFQNYRLTYDADYTYLEGYVSYYFGGGQSIVINSYVNGLNGLTWSPYTGTVEASSTSSGALSIGKVNNGLTVPYLRTSGGIQFGSGTSTLNYYEEGTFTPTPISSIFSSATVTFGRYVRIGNQITVNCRWEVNPGGTGKKYFVFNLPFAFNISGGVGYTGAVSNYDSGVSAYSSNVGTTVRNSSGSDTQQYVEAVFTTTNATALHFSMTYFTF